MTWWSIQKVIFATTSEKKLFCENERLEPTWKSSSWAWAIYKISFPSIVFATKISRFCLLKQGPLKIWKAYSRLFTFTDFTIFATGALQMSKWTIFDFVIKKCPHYAITYSRVWNKHTPTLILFAKFSSGYVYSRGYVY